MAAHLSEGRDPKDVCKELEVYGGHHHPWPGDPVSYGWTLVKEPVRLIQKEDPGVDVEKLTVVYRVNTELKRNTLALDKALHEDAPRELMLALAVRSDFKGLPEILEEAVEKYKGKSILD